MKTVLVPTDLSPDGELALDFASQIARKAGATVALVHSFDLYSDMFAAYNGYRKKIDQSSVIGVYSLLNTLKDAMELKYEIHVEVRLYSFGDINSVILQGARDYKPDLIVVGTYEEYDIRKSAFENRVALASDRFDIPILAISPLFKWSVRLNIMLGVDAELAATEVIKPVFELADILHAKLFLVIFNRETTPFAIDSSAADQQSINENLKKLCTNQDIEVIYVAAGDLSDFSSKVISDRNIDVLSVIKTNSSPEDRLLKGYAAQKAG